MRRTLLDLTQSILSALNSDEVNSISDTTESLQVANIIKDTYLNIIYRVDYPKLNQLVQLDPSLDPTQPVLMYVPANVGRIEWIKYFNSNILNDVNTSTHGINVDIVPSANTASPPPPGYQYVTILPIQQFIDMTNSFNPNDPNVESFVFTDSDNGRPGVFTCYYRNDRQPQYCTISGTEYVVFDSYDSTQDSTLQSSKTECFGEIIPNWNMTDTFIPDLDDEQFTLLLNEAKSMAFFELKQSAHPKAEQNAKRGWSSVQKDKSLINRPTYFDELPNFGRGGLGARSNVSYFKSRGWDVN
jgi:hypothetical protein